MYIRVKHNLRKIFFEFKLMLIDAHYAQSQILVVSELFDSHNFYLASFPEGDIFKFVEKLLKYYFLVPEIKIRFDIRFANICSDECNQSVIKNKRFV